MRTHLRSFLSVLFLCNLTACAIPLVATPHHVIGSTLKTGLGDYEDRKDIVDEVLTHCRKEENKTERFCKELSTGLAKEQAPLPLTKMDRILTLYCNDNPYEESCKTAKQMEAQMQSEECQGSSDSALCKQAELNKQALDWYRDNEWQYNRTDTTKPPLVCVSLSGGGIRAAAFAIGVMKGLSEKQVKNEANSHQFLLDRVDILSGTSGGAYALSWYYMNYLQEYGPDGNSDSPWSPKVQQELQDHADFIPLSTYALSGFINVGLMSPVNLLLNGIVATHTNTSYFGNLLYKKAIRDTFHKGQSATLDNLKEVLDRNKHKLPNFVITTTARVDESNFHFDSLLRNTVFEFTPLRVGNDGFTYMSSKTFSERYEEMNIAQIVATAGAAPDSSQLVSGSLRRTLAAMLNADYGRYIRNYNDTRPWLRRWFNNLTPAPFYLFSEHYNHDLRGSHIYLSDGGHQENLALYPLVRRQCQNIIVVDAEFDRFSTFEAYFKAKASIQGEMRVNMTLEKQKDGKRVDDLEDVLKNLAESGRTRDEVESLQRHASLCCFSGRYPVMQGKIRYFPILDKERNELNWKEIKLIYVKLALDTPLFQGWDTLDEKTKDHVRNKIGVKAADYYAATIKDECDIRYGLTCAFPQFSTTHQSFTPKQFEAYVDLGSTMIKTNVAATLRSATPSSSELDSIEIKVCKDEERDEELNADKDDPCRDLPKDPRPKVFRSFDTTN